MLESEVNAIVEDEFDKDGTEQYVLKVRSRLSIAVAEKKFRKSLSSADWEMLALAIETRLDADIWGKIAERLAELPHGDVHNADRLIALYDAGLRFAEFALEKRRYFRPCFPAKRREDIEGMRVRLETAERELYVSYGTCRNYAVNPLAIAAMGELTAFIVMFILGEEGSERFGNAFADAFVIMQRHPLVRAFTSTGPIPQ